MGVGFGMGEKGGGEGGGGYCWGKDGRRKEKGKTISQPPV